MNQILVIKNFQIDIVEKLHLVKQSDCTAAKPTSSHPTSKNTRNLGNTRNWFCHNLLVDLLGRLSCDDNHNGWQTMSGDNGFDERVMLIFKKTPPKLPPPRSPALGKKPDKYLHFKTNIYNLKQIFTL